MRRAACGGCGGTGLEVFLDLGSSPLADAFPTDPSAVEPRYPLQLAVCVDCWLVQLMEVVPDGLLFGADYGFYSSTSPSIVEYDRQFATWVKSRWPNLPVVEIACNDGSLLQHFGDVPALGVEPASGPADVARERGLAVVNAPFTRALAGQIDPAPHLVIAKNVLAHVADLDDFIAGVATLTAGGGVAIVEVQYLGDLLLGNQFDHVYHEHRYYFTASSLGRVLARHGLGMRWVFSSPAQGGSLRVVVEHGNQRPIPGPWMDGPDAYAGVQGRAEHLRHGVLELLENERAAGRKVAGYGASAKSTTLLNWCGIGPDLLDHVVDTTPWKIGRYTPGTHIPIVGPGERDIPDTYLLLVWNYLSGVIRRERPFLDGGGRFIVPIPQPVIL